MFIYSGYWKTWNRILWKGDSGIVELDLTPVNPTHPKVWERSALQVIRFHCTSISASDKLTSLLPSSVLKLMEEKYGPDLTNRMLMHDYMSEITPTMISAACNASNGGGVPLQYIKDFADKKAKFHTWDGNYNSIVA